MTKNMTLSEVAAAYGWEAHGRVVDALARRHSKSVTRLGVVMQFPNPECTWMHDDYEYPQGGICPFDTVRVKPPDTLMDAAYVQNARDKMARGGVYGRSPLMEALPDLQAMRRRISTRQKEKTMTEQPTMHSAHTVRCGDCEYYWPAVGEGREQCHAPHNVKVTETWDHVMGMTRVEKPQQPPKMVNANGTCPWHKSKPMPRKGA